jgi:PPM family protein phosphatase
VDLTHQSVRRGDILILCSDGLSGLVRREEFASLAKQHGDPQSLCAALVDLANARGGPDNITVVAVRFEGDGLPEAVSEDGVGYRNYHLPPTANQPDAAAPQPDEGPTSQPASELTLDRLRNLGLIAILLGVLMLLLAVWR